MGKNAAASNLAANEFCRTRGRVTAKLSVTRRRGVGRGVCRPQHKFFTIFQQQHTLIAGQPHRVLAPSGIESVAPSPCLALPCLAQHIHMHLLALTFIHFISYNIIPFCNAQLLDKLLTHRDPKGEPHPIAKSKSKSATALQLHNSEHFAH